MTKIEIDADTLQTLIEKCVATHGTLETLEEYLNDTDAPPVIVTIATRGKIRIRGAYDVLVTARDINTPTQAEKAAAEGSQE